jgi:PAS domain S-box-containing protein
LNLAGTLPKYESDKRSEQSLPARYEALFSVSRAVAAYREPKELFRVLAREMHRVVDFDFLGLFLYDEATNHLEVPVLETVKDPAFTIPEGFPAEHTQTWWVHRHQEPIVVSSRDQETRFPHMMEIYKRYGIQSSCVLPLKTAHRRLGSLGFGVDHPDAYSAEEVRYLSLVADQVALAVDNAMTIEQQERVQEELRKQKAHFEKLFELAPEPIVLRDINNRALRVNKEFTKLFGFAPEEAIGRNICDLIVPEGLKEEAERLRKVSESGQRVNAELVRQRKDGTLVTVSLVTAPVSAAGGAQKSTESIEILRKVRKRRWR